MNLPTPIRLLFSSLSSDLGSLFGEHPTPVHPPLSAPIVCLISHSRPYLPRLVLKSLFPHTPALSQLPSLVRLSLFRLGCIPVTVLISHGERGGSISLVRCGQCEELGPTHPFENILTLIVA